VSTKNAIEIAKALTLGIVEPIASQIDPLLLGRVDRSMKIAEAYSIRLNPNFNGIKKLIGEYPSHEFVIDFTEAKGLFPSVREPDAKECELETFLRQTQYTPYPRNDLIKVLSTTKKEPVKESAKSVDENNNAKEHEISNAKPEPAVPAKSLRTRGTRLSSAE
jgi:hypothetical protein